ncbi:MAG: GNAT family N-acetyltransferase [Roseiflexaceae bacterium]
MPPFSSTPLDDLARAVEANVAEFLLALGRAGGGEERAEPQIAWVIGDSPIDYNNAVVRADLTPEQADQAIAESIERLQAHAAPGTWHVGPSMRPADLGARLIAQGFAYAGDEIGMAIDLNALPTKLEAPQTLAIDRVRDERELAIWIRTLATGFGEGEREAAWTGEMYRRIGLGDEQPWRHYLGRLDRVPVATASLFLGAGVAGIYFVFTVEKARRQGIGAAITLAALRDAHALGYQIGVLGASEMGYAVYQRIGFQDCCRISLYEWRSS